MTIRERGGKVQLIRNQYSPEKKRGVQVVLGSFERYYDAVKQIDSILLEKLTADEREQLDGWFADKQQQRLQKTVEYAAAVIVRHLDALTENYDPARCSDEQIEQIRGALSALLEQRRKRKKREGHTTA